MPEANAGEKDVIAFFKAAVKTFEYLWGRWQDEKKYENINDYAKPLENLAATHKVTIVKMNKRPFGCDIQQSGKTYKIVMTARDYKLEQIA